MPLSRFYKALRKKYKVITADLHFHNSIKTITADGKYQKPLDYTLKIVTGAYKNMADLTLVYYKT